MTPEELRAAGVTLVELSFVDNAGITRVKSVPLDRMPVAVGASPCFETFGSDDVMAPGRHLGGPDGDLRLTPDMSRPVALSAQPGWGWVPADKYDQDGTRFVPSSASEAAAALESSAVLAAALGPELHDAIVTVRRAEAERCSGLDARALTSAVLWRW